MVTAIVVTMAVSRKRLKNDVDRRMDNAVSMSQVFMTEKDIQAVTRANFDYWISELRKGEQMTRKLRKRLEALRDKSSERSCPVCGQPVVGRPDAVYCEAMCRIRAYRQAQKSP